MLESVRVVIWLDDFPFFVKYAAQSIGYQRLSAEISVLVVDHGGDRSQLDRFAGFLPSGLNPDVVTPIGDSIPKVALGDADAVAFHSGRAYWTSPDRLHAQLSAVAGPDPSWVWHPTVVREQERLSVQPRRGDESGPRWESIVARTADLAGPLPVAVPRSAADLPLPGPGLRLARSDTIVSEITSPHIALELNH